MITELHASIVLAVSFTFFLIIIGLLTLGMIMRPDRWGETTETRKLTP